VYELIVSGAEADSDYLESFCQGPGVFCREMDNQAYNQELLFIEWLLEQNKASRFEALRMTESRDSAGDLEKLEG